MSDLPDRIRFSKAVYTAEPDPSDVPPAERLVRLGPEAEGRIVYGEPGQLNSRRRVYLLDAASRPRAYVRPELPIGLTVARIVADALGPSLDLERAVALRAILGRKHLVLVDGTRLGLRGRALEHLVARLAGEERLVVSPQLERKALQRWEEVGSALQNHPLVRRLADPAFGEVAEVGPEDVTVARRTRDPVDAGQELVAYASPRRVRSDPKPLVPHPRGGGEAATCYLTVREPGEGRVLARPVFPEALGWLQPGDYVEFAFFTGS